LNADIKGRVEAHQDLEYVALSVVAGLPANPRLLDVQIEALTRARTLISDQIDALIAATPGPNDKL
jgi:hypothetical protein